MTVTGLIPKNNKKITVFIDEKIAFVLYKGDFNKYHISEGEEIPEEDYDEIMHRILPKRALDRSYKLLLSRDYTERQLKEKLFSDDYPENIIDDTIQLLKEQKYIDDRRYTENYIFWQSKKKSRRRLMADLKQKGIKEEDASAVYEMLLEQNDIDDEEVLIRNFLDKKKIVPGELSYEEKEKITTMLLRKGFSFDAVKHILNGREY